MVRSPTVRVVHRVADQGKGTCCPAAAALEFAAEIAGHLRAAYDQEAITLSRRVSGVVWRKGKPTEPGAKLQNVTWALSLLAPFRICVDREWARSVQCVHAEGAGV